VTTRESGVTARESGVTARESGSECALSRVEVLLLVVGLMLAAVLPVRMGHRLRLPWPALMVLIGVAVAAVPALPDVFALDPELILPLFLPPLLFATAQRTSWALFRARPWRSCPASR
jgi:monovalent cation/hydrogen antiporter